MSCAIWQQSECQKVDLTVLDISSAVIRKVDRCKHSGEYFALAIVFSFVLALVPGLYRVQARGIEMANPTNGHLSTTDINDTHQQQPATILNVEGIELFDRVFKQLPVPEASLILDSMVASSSSSMAQFVILVAMAERLFLSLFLFFLLCVAERTYKEVNLIFSVFIKPSSDHWSFFVLPALPFLEVLLPPYLIAPGSPLRASTLSSQQGSQHQDMALRPLLPAEAWSSAIGGHHRLHLLHTCRLRSYLLMRAGLFFAHGLQSCTNCNCTLLFYYSCYASRATRPPRSSIAGKWSPGPFSWVFSSCASSSSAHA